VNRDAISQGLELGLVCDIGVASRSASFGLTEIKVWTEAMDRQNLPVGSISWKAKGFTDGSYRLLNVTTSTKREGLYIAGKLFPDGTTVFFFCIFRCLYRCLSRILVNDKPYNLN
jgi:hypothetical protein